MLKLTTLYPIQKFRHNGYPVTSNASGKVLVYGPTHCWVLLLE
jgi:hypothetical protein